MAGKSGFTSAIIILSIIIFWSSNQFLEGSLGSKAALGKELQSEPENLSEWKIKDQPPFNYRVLFPAIIIPLSKIVPGTATPNQKFFMTYYIMSMVFLIGTALAFFHLLAYIFQSDKTGFAGTLLFLLSPPVLLAYTLPVHTREDILGYLLLVLGIYFLLKRQILIFLIISILGALNRETLLILPFLYFFFCKDGIQKKFIITGIPIIIWLSLRYFLGGEPYDPWLGFRWNINNLAQAGLLFIISFHFLWYPFFAVISRKTKIGNNTSLQFFQQSGPYVFFLVFITTFLFGIIIELRLLYLLFPWIIICAIVYFRDHYSSIQLYLRSKIFFILCGIALTGIVTGIYFMEVLVSTLRISKYDVPYNIWLVVVLIYGGLTFLSLGFLLFNRNKPNHGVETI